jgi:hypothetical protein
MPFYARMGFEPVPEREQRPALRELVDDETARGLDPAARCVMRYRAEKPRRSAPAAGREAGPASPRRRD